MASSKQRVENLNAKHTEIKPQAKHLMVISLQFTRQNNRAEKSFHESKMKYCMGKMVCHGNLQVREQEHQMGFFPSA